MLIKRLLAECLVRFENFRKVTWLWRRHKYLLMKLQSLQFEIKVHVDSINKYQYDLERLRQLERQMHTDLIISVANTQPRREHVRSIIDVATPDGAEIKSQTRRSASM